MRYFLAVAILGVALAGALWIHTSVTVARKQVIVKPDYSLSSTSAITRQTVIGPNRKPGWVDPLAIVVAFVGAGAAVALVAKRPS